MPTEIKTKACTNCKIEYPATREYFYSAKKVKDGLASWCRKCQNMSSRKYRQTEKGKAIARKSMRKYQQSEKGKVKQAGYTLKRKYNITLEQYDKIFEAQNGVCAICGLPELLRRLTVDHDHITDRVRGLLCINCNVAVGYFERTDDKEMAFKAILGYLGYVTS